MATRKVLLSGDVDGKYAALFARVASVNKSNGPFDLLLCTGRFLPHDEAAAEKSLAELRPFLTGAKPVPVPTYFLGAAGPAAPRLLALLDEPESTADVHYLGRAGLRQLKGLSLAFLDLEHSQEELAGLQAELRRAEGDLDFLLTCEWPDRVTALCAPGAVPEGLDASGSAAIADLALAARPRYHVAACKGSFFARVPYLNKDLGSHVTRFIGLAAVGNAAKQKSLHALGLAPAASMDAGALQQQPAGSTPCPYALPAAKRPLEEQLGGQDWRWQEGKRQRRAAEPSWGRPDVVKDSRKTVYVRNLPFAATEEDITAFFSACGPVADLHRGATDGKLHGWGFVQFQSVEAAERAAELSGAELMGRELFIEAAGRGGGGGAPKPSGDPVQGCWFCLSSADADLSLIVSVGEEIYVAMDKGPINKHHVLLLPIEHQPNSLELSPAAYAELERYLSALRTAYASKGQLMIAFERHLTLKSKGGNHMQFNVLPVPASAASTARSVAEELARQHGVPLRAVSGPVKGEDAREALREAAGTGEFFQLLLPDGARLVHAVGKGQRHPVSFGREVAARLAGAPDRADWRNCKVDEAQEQRMTSAFKQFFKPYDIMS